MTLHVLRRERNSLVNVLRTFIYDPLVEWAPRRMVPAAEPAAEVANPDGLQKLADIERRLHGIIGHTELPLSIAGHVHHLIQEATSVDNLAVMYIGWAPYL